MALQMPAFISGLLPNGMTPTQQANNPNPSGVFDPQTGNVLPPQLLGGRLNAANEMLREGSSGAPVGSWTQGMNRVLQGLVGGYEEKKYADQYMQGMQQGAQAGGNFLSSLMGGGGSTPTAAPVAGAPASGSSNATVTPGQPTGGINSPLAKQAFDYFVGKGYTPAAAAGLVGNFNQESGFSPSNISAANGGGGDGGVSQHLAQWNGPRLTALNAFAAQRGTSPGDYQTQLDFVDHELNTTEAATGNALRGVTDPVHAAAIAAGYERPQGWSPSGNPSAINGWQNRARSALSAFQTFGGGGAQSQVAAGPASAPAPYQTVQQEMAQADATSGQPLGNGAPTPTPVPPGPVQVASLDPSAGVAQAAQQANIPLPPVDPRTAVATPGQQAVLSAASPSPAAAPGGPGAPPLTPGGQSVVAALPPPGGAPSAAPPLSQGGQQVAQAAMPPALPQQPVLPPQLIQQYTQIMQNPYVPETTKAMATQAVMSRISPHGVDNIDMGDHIEQVDKLTGQPLRSLPKSVAGVAVNADQNYLNPYTGQPLNGAPQTPAYHWMTPDEKRQAGIAEDAMIQVDRAGKAFTPGGQTINVGGPGDKYNEDIKTALSDTPAALIKGIPNEQQSLYAIHAMQGALQRIKQNGGTTGVGTEELTRLKSAINTGANALGIAPLADTDNIADQNVLAKYNRQLAGAMAKGVAGARVTNFEMMNFLKSNPGQDTDPQGGERLLGIAEQMHARNLAVGQQIEDYAGQTQARGQKIDPGQISQITRNYDEQHHITDPITGQDLVKNPILPAAPPVTKQQGANQPQQAFPQPGKPALGFLKDSPTPEMRMEFDKRYGPGAAAKALGEQ